jgi:excisionase family DNA binding protein
MQSLDAKEAAQFLKMGESTLKRKAAAGEIPGKRAGHKWVFIREHLADYVSGRYTERGSFRVIDGGKSTPESNTWQSTNKKTQKAGTSTSLTETDKEYANLLGLATKNKRKSCTTS